MTQKKIVRIRFYAELNDFLEPSRRFKRLAYPFTGNPAIKDLIEAIGVPHTEIDLILVNGRSVGFDYRVKTGDDIAIYPVFEAMDIDPVIRLRPKPLRDLHFIADTNLGRLARYLRMLGFDTLYRNDFEDRQIVDLSVNEHRIILTRDRGILKYNAVTHGYWVRHIHIMKQVREVVDRFDLQRQIAPFSRCMVCNGIVAPVGKADVMDRLEEGTKRDFDTFFQCRACGKIYWKGSHYQRMMKLIEAVRT